MFAMIYERGTWPVFTLSWLSLFQPKFDSFDARVDLCLYAAQIVLTHFTELEEGENRLALTYTFYF